MNVNIVIMLILHWGRLYIKSGQLIMFLLSSVNNYQNQPFRKKNSISGTLSECQTVWNQIRTDVLSVLIWIQTVCKGYQSAGDKIRR